MIIIKTILFPKTKKMKQKKKTAQKDGEKSFWGPVITFSTLFLTAIRCLMLPIYSILSLFFRSFSIFFPRFSFFYEIMKSVGYWNISTFEIPTKKWGINLSAKKKKSKGLFVQVYFDLLTIKKWRVTGSIILFRCYKIQFKFFVMEGWIRYLVTYSTLSRKLPQLFPIIFFLTQVSLRTYLKVHKKSIS